MIKEFKRLLFLPPLWFCPEHKHLLPADKAPGEETESLVGKQVEYVTEQGEKRTGLEIGRASRRERV